MIACRLFSLSVDEKVKENVRSFLASLRQTLSQWMKQVLHLMESKTAAFTTEAINKTQGYCHPVRHNLPLDLCAGGCDPRVLRDPDTLAIFIDSAIVLQNIIPPKLSSSFLTTPIHG